MRRLEAMLPVSITLVTLLFCATFVDAQTPQRRPQRSVQAEPDATTSAPQVAPVRPRATPSEAQGDAEQPSPEAGAGDSAEAKAGESPGEAKEQKQKEKEEEGRFLRLFRGDDGEHVALQSALVRCAPKDRAKAGPTVDLISAVHVAEEAYYDELNRLFATYDAVLFELVAPEGTRIPKGGVRPSGSPVSMVQNAMTGVMELEFQLEGIDYTRDNLVHADMSPDQFAESMRRRGESVIQIFFRMLGHAMARQGRDGSGSGDLRLLLALFNKDRALALKRVLAEQFQDMEGALGAIEGPDGSTLISERNKVALEVLREQIDAGKQKLAVFYGAGHMSDFEERLDADFDLVPVSRRWLVAWDLASQPVADEIDGQEEADEEPERAEEADAEAEKEQPAREAGRDEAAPVGSQGVAPR